MTITETFTDGTPGNAEDRIAAATLVGETAATMLPADHGWAVRIDPPGEQLPVDACDAVGARLGDHVVVLVTTPSMTRRVQVGPPPADSLLDGLAPAVTAVGEVLALPSPSELVPMDLQDVSAELTARSLVCSLVDGGEHLVTVIVTPPEPDDHGGDTVTFQPIVGGATRPGQSALDVLHDVEMGVTVELGRTRMPLRDILTVVPGSVIELDRAASAPVDVLVNGTLIARGEVVVIDEEFGIRITEVVGHEQTIHGDPDS